MKVEYYNPVQESKGCVIRAISASLNKDYNEVKEDLIKINSTYNDESVFEQYLLENNFIVDNNYCDKLIDDISLNGINVVFAYHDDWYHMICIIDNVIYDKFEYDKLKTLKVIKVYKLK